MLQLVKQTIESIQENKLLSSAEIEKAKHIFNQNTHVILSQGREKITLQIENEEEEINVEILAENGNELSSKIDGSYADWEVYNLVALYVIEDDLEDETLYEGLKYTREGMKKRVLNERMDKAKKATYKVQLSKNLYGEHTLINETTSR